MLFYYYYYYNIYLSNNIYIYGPASDCHPLPRRDGDGPYLYIWIFARLHKYVITCAYLRVYIPGVSTNYPFFWVRLILFGVVSRKKGLLSSKQVLAIYTIDYIGITKLKHVSVLCLSCLILDQAPSHIIQTQAHN